MAQHNELGRWGEGLAACYLRDKGYIIVQNDWKSVHRDIDFIARDGDTTVFVEVKTRRNNLYGEPEEAVDQEKLENLRRAVNHYIKSRRVDTPVRFDIVSITGTPEAMPEIKHIIDVPLL